MGGIAIGGPNQDSIFLTVGTSVLDINTSSISYLNHPGTSLYEVKNLGIKNGYTKTVNAKLVLGE